VLFKDGDSYFTTEVYPENMLYIFPLDGLQVVNPQYILNTVSTRTEETAYNFLLNNVSNVILFINRYIVKNYQDWGTKEDFIRKNK